MLVLLIIIIVMALASCSSESAPEEWNEKQYNRDIIAGLVEARERLEKKKTV